MAISNLLPQNPAGYTGYQSLLKRKQTQKPSPVVTKPLVHEEILQQPAPRSSAMGASTVASPSGMGSYKGTQINAGTDADIQAQMRAIDTPTANVRGLVEPKPQRLSRATAQPEVTPPPTYSGLVQTLAERAQKPAEQTTEAYNLAQDINRRLEEFRGSAIDTKKGIYSAPTSARVMQGRDAAVQQANAEKEAALASQFAGASNLYGASLTGQGQQLTALGTAAGLAQPSPASYGQTVFNPLTGKYEGGSGGGNLDPQTQASSFAQQVISGGMTYEQAVSSMGYAGGAGKTFLDNAITQAGGNPLQLQSQGQGQQSVLGNIPALTAAETAAKGIKNQIVSYLQSRPNLNPANLAAGNIIDQWLKGKQLADPEYQTLFNFLNEYTNTLAPILGVGGDPTNLKTQIAANFINAKASGQSIAQVLDAMEQLAGKKIADYRSGATGGDVVSQPETTVQGGGAANEGWGWNP